jgi:hypothetical protein
MCEQYVKEKPPKGGFSCFTRTSYFCAGAATALATGVAGAGTLVLMLGFGTEGELVFWFIVGVGADFGFPDPDADTVRTVSFFSGQNKIARIAMMSRMITIVGQWALVNDQSDDACAVCGTVFAVVGWVCATTGADGVVAGVVAAEGAVFTATGALGVTVTEGEVFTATGEVAGCVVATGAEAAGVFWSSATVFAMATSVLPMPFNVACTAACCEGVSVVFAAIEAFN